HLVVITGPVEEDLGLAIPPRVINHTQARRPVLGECVVRGHAGHAVLLPSQTYAEAEMFVEHPVVVDPTGISQPLRCRDRWSEFGPEESCGHRPRLATQSPVQRTGGALVRTRS